MIVVYHFKNRITEVILNLNQKIKFEVNDPIALGLQKLALAFPDKKIVWCHVNLKEQLNVSEMDKLFHHKKLLVSYNPSNTPFIDKAIGYVEESPFIKINKKVPYPTWQMSSGVGGIHSAVVLALKDEIAFEKDFDYFLCSLAKLGMRKGLLCYSEPRLLKQNLDISSTKTSKFTLFRFVKQHYKTRWVFLLLLNLMLYERKLPVAPFIFSLFYKNRSKANINLDTIKVQSSRKTIDKATVDVIIPTIGRKSYLYDVLCDLRNQTHLSKNVIIVEQNPDEGSESELDYLTNEIWPFTIKHTFTHQAGACNARNVALEQINSEWIFFADDDIRIENDFLLKIVESIDKLGVKAVSMSCLQKNEKPVYKTIFQWPSFGSGCSFVFADNLKKCKFKMGYEFGFGEDGDFGMQLRNQGCDVLYLPEPEILHLKAPMGGFRTKPVLQWQNDGIQPKPSPTIMLYQISHQTQEQIWGYKIILFFKYYKYQKTRNPIRYFINYRNQWERSVFWANTLKKQNEV
ncbi:MULTISPECIES: glycosyltransferase family 2 protein [unclassified Flavobacterium]|uniref:glycosyltransferase family 2 protein n=1 Tax=unclassified Flavobacterium TaxID=196869 RepID=UPI0025C03110|nr:MULTISPECIES: glycosyltransferase family A protein [unclassified Flavobacterium]